jgi:hypothetical protein
MIVSLGGYMTLTIFGYNKRTELHPSNFSQHTPFPDVIYDFFASTGFKLLKISAITQAGECGSGYSTATWGYFRKEEISKIPPLEYMANPPLFYEDADEFQENFSIDEDGGDGYYPCGSAEPKPTLLALFNPCRVLEERLYVFSGASALGKSTFALSLASDPAEIYETDSGIHPDAVELEYVKYVVLGNKSPKLNEAALEVLQNLKGRTIIYVEFKK